MPARQRRQVGMHRQRAVRLAAKHFAVFHGRDQEAPVGQPAQAGRLLGHAADLLDPPLEVHGNHLFRIEVRRPQAVFVPPQAFQVGVPGSQHGQIAFRHCLVSCLSPRSGPVLFSMRRNGRPGLGAGPFWHE
ncbi:hypothetical protein G6F57_016441 [Rhizopus arrhizus]|nr:hypothetical protein G6F57_016441 [Rhizopus arrhizus]